MKNTEKRTIKLQTYKTPPPYGGSTLDWWKFFLRPHKWPLIFWYTLSFFRQSLFRIHPFFLGTMIGLVESGEAATDPMKLISWITLYATLLIIAALGIMLIIPAGQLMDRIAKEVALYGFTHYMKLPESWHEERASGEKLQRLTTARTDVFKLLENSFWHVIAIPGIIMVILVSLYLLEAPGHYMIIYPLFITTYLIGSKYTSEWLHKRFADYNATLEKVIGGVYEFIVSTATVRYFNLKDHVLKKGEELETQNHFSKYKVHTTVVKRWLVMDFLAFFWIFSIIALASFEVIQGTLPLSAYAAILFFNLTIWTELDWMTMIYKDLIEQWEGVKRLFNILTQKPKITDKDNATTLQTDSASIHFNAMDFHYNEQKSVIQNFTLEVKAGEKIGMVGPSGAGKSTIVKLLLRFYDIDTGSIRINDHNIQDITLSSLQNAVAVIPQDVTLFNHPLIENIRYGRLDATDEEVQEAARKANAHDFIENLPDGYNTIVGERGVKLSGGQRQRIAIARAILKDAPILILDEATSALDSESEQLIQESLADLMKGKTVIAIAHRLSTIARLDRLIVMQEGTIIEEGTHSALLKRKNGLYAKLWAMQSGGFLKD